MLFYIYTFQICVAVLQALQNGDFGVCSPAEIEAYRSRCHAIFPIALAFAPEMPNGIVDRPANGEEQVVKESYEAGNGIASSAVSVTTSELSDGIAA
jgi:hypothetical protein